MSAQVIWYSARAAGIVAWALAAASVIWGLVVSTRAVTNRPRPAWWFDLHRFLGGAAVTFVAIHMVSILLDTYVHFGLVNVLVPLTGTWRPLAVAFGIVAMYLLAAVEVTSLLRRRIPKRVWRGVHFATFALYLVATVHAFAAGTDAWSLAFTGAAVASLLAVGGLTFLRVWQSSQRRTAPVAKRGQPNRSPVPGNSFRSGDPRATTMPRIPSGEHPTDHVEGSSERRVPVRASSAARTRA
ncbi:MAG TPA: ferric reductase-like transmembrane domain-containing protein [Actinomycetota bacterium]|nr:ferric reductase-like transmembrane domain-containing protein [Actinomycetota bacterium]